MTYKTNPLSPDTDNDGFSDSDEVLVLKMNPLNPKFDYDPETIITDYRQVQPIIEKVCKNLGISLRDRTIKVLSETEFKLEWERKIKWAWTGKPSISWWAYKPKPESTTIILADKKAYQVIIDIFWEMGWVDHALSYQEHYHFADKIMRFAAAIALDSAAMRRLEEMGWEFIKPGDTERNKAKFISIVERIKREPQNEAFQGLFLNWLAVTEDEELGLSSEVKANKQLSSKSAMQLYYHLMKKDNTYPITLQKKMEKRTTLDSYLKEITDIAKLRLVPGKSQGERDTDIIAYLYFVSP